MEPWLTQNWSFFAPHPPSSDIGILVRFSRYEAVDESRSFVDVTTKGLESTKEKLVPPREYRLLTSALDSFLSAEDSLVSFHPEAAGFESRLTDRDRLADEMMASNATPNETKNAYLRARRILIRAIQHFYDKSSSRSPGTDDAIQVRIVNYSYPTFGDRRLPTTNDFDFRTLPWWKVS